MLGAGIFWGHSHGGIPLHGSEANHFNDELLVAQMCFSGSRVTLSYDHTSAVKGVPGLIQESPPDNPRPRLMTHNQWQGKRNYLCRKGEPRQQLLLAPDAVVCLQGR